MSNVQRTETVELGVDGKPHVLINVKLTKQVQLDLFSGEPDDTTVAPKYKPLPWWVI